MTKQSSIRDIVNRDIVNLDNCESEPIHIPGSIQPHGFLVAATANNYTIRFCSGNTKDFIGISCEELLGKPISKLFTTGEGRTLVDYLDNNPAQANTPLRIEINGRKLECVAHPMDDLMIIEFEPQAETEIDPNSLYIQTREFIKDIERSKTLKELCQRVADGIQQITGYDRVMVYRFDEQYNGEVFAESLGSAIEPFLGLHYPHTDIPVQARELYLKNLLRIIVDVNYQPVPVYTLNDGGSTVLDMSHTALRSVSPIHIQYLQNMGVGATLTISLVLDNKLWGLIACHHYNAKHLSHTVRTSARLQGYFLTSQIRGRELNEEYDISRTINEKLQSLLSYDGKFTTQSIGELVEQPEVLDICRSTGVAITLNGAVYHAGDTPKGKELEELLKWLRKNHPFTNFHTDKLSAIYEGGKDIIEESAGILYHSLGGGRGSITWFRQESQKEVNWGGDPEKAIVRDEKGLHPRKSFALWKEIVKGKSKPWLRAELQAAESFTHFLQRQLHLLFIMEEEMRYRKLSAQLQEANAELENINFISAHDLKEPLRKIQVFASRILAHPEGLPEGVGYSVERMQAAANRMQALIAAILSYSKLGKVEEARMPVNLNEIVSSAKEEMSDEIEQTGAVISVDDLPQITGVPFLLNQVFLNLIRNSIKFAREGVPSKIDIRYAGTESTTLIPGEPASSFHKITVSDNGIGFDNQFSETMFKVFTRLNQHEEQPGTGIGLSLCRKIMQNHGGQIKANGKPGEGAEFSLYFPL